MMLMMVIVINDRDDIAVLEKQNSIFSCSEEPDNSHVNLFNSTPKQFCTL
jgi:hypothetical protein